MKGFDDRRQPTRLWKCSNKVTKLIAHTVLANGVLHDDLVESDTILYELISEWVAIHTPKGAKEVPQIILKMIDKLVIAASASKCIYPFCSYLTENISICFFSDVRPALSKVTPRHHSKYQRDRTIPRVPRATTRSWEPRTKVCPRDSS